jgi:hypothetical protein
MKTSKFTDEQIALLLRQGAKEGNQPAVILGAVRHGRLSSGGKSWSY